MKNDKSFLFVFGILAPIIFLSACGPTQEELDEHTTQVADSIFSTQTVIAKADIYEPTETLTPIPTDTPTLSPTATSTNTPEPTNTPTPTPTLYPLNIEETLAEIVLQVKDLEEFYQQIGRNLDKLQIIQTNPYMTHWSVPLPPEIINSYSTAYDTRRITTGTPQLSAFHNTAIYVFPDSDSAHSFFLLDTQSMEKGFLLDTPTIGDESVAFSGYLKDSGWPIGGVIWRYREVYVFVSAQLFFPVTPDSIVKIAQNIQNRLAEIIE